MSVYMIVDVKEVMDREKFGKYVEKVPATVEKFGGKYLARGGRIKVFSGDWRPERLIIVEFESMDQFQAWCNSPEYRAVAALREQGARTNALVIEGC